MTPGRPGHMSYRADIDGLRALAVLAVVGFHAFPASVPGGFIGVDVFFVISGYLISGILFEGLARGTFSFADFYARRIRRIFPALALVLGSCLALGWIALLADEYKQLGRHVAAGAGFVSNLLLWSEAGYFDTAADTKPLLHLWSLGVEEQFYLAWPLAAWLAWEARRSVIALVAFVALVSFALNVFGVGKHASATFYAPVTRFWELMAGAALAWQLVRRPDWRLPARVATPLAMLGAALLILGFWRIDRNTLFPGAWAAIPVAGAMLMIGAGSAAWLNARVLARPAMVWVGLISYPLYLWHWPLLSFARIVEGETPRPIIRGLAVGLAFLLAWATYRLVERPIRRGPRHGRATVAALVAIVAGIGFAGFVADRQRGFPERSSLQAMGENQRLVAPGKSDDPDSHEACMRQLGLQGDMRWCQSTGPSPGVALIGDSHARAMYDGLAPLLQARGRSVAVVGGRLLLGVEVYPPGDGFEMNVSQNGPRATRWAATAPGVETVVMFSGVATSLVYAPFIFRLADDPSVTDPRTIWEIALRHTLDAFAGKGRKVVFVLMHPQLDFDPRSCLEGRPLRIGHRARTPCAIPRALHDQWYGAYRDMVLQVLRDYPTVTVFDSAAYLCDGQWCWAKKDGKMLYKDGAHLSAEGARQLGVELINVMDGAPSRMLR
jgi:peptidoglycan/LPS O-acetylase OafA/YrhL